MTTRIDLLGGGGAEDPALRVNSILPSRAASSSLPPPVPPVLLVESSAVIMIRYARVRFRNRCWGTARGTKDHGPERVDGEDHWLCPEGSLHPGAGPSGKRLQDLSDSRPQSLWFGDQDRGPSPRRLRRGSVGCGLPA